MGHEHDGSRALHQGVVAIEQRSKHGSAARVVEVRQQVHLEPARRAIGGKADTYIGGSIGPGTKLPSLGHITVDALAAAYAEQIRALVEALNTRRPLTT